MQPLMGSLPARAARSPHAPTLANEEPRVLDLDLLGSAGALPFSANLLVGKKVQLYRTSTVVVPVGIPTSGGTIPD